jgi:hypothetical protein
VARPVRLWVAAILLVLGSLVATAVPAQAYERHLGTMLYGTSSYSYARGHADYDQCCRHRGFDVHMWNMGELPGSSLVVCAGADRLSGAVHYDP